MVDELEKEGNVSECIGYLWMASDSGDMESTSHLAEICRSGKMVEKDEAEPN